MFVIKRYYGSVMVWMFVSPQNSYVEILTPNIVVLEGGAFGRSLGHAAELLL